ncbi:MAG: DUF2325 domain-containing protein [Gammaproteobacteria bacterium]|nr:DUF2325 domain-containing protein [Gammaproteobacteria bacterium]MCY4275207.1 DUF2325 domain-containing protein [Gammaproteobacteria bacterium]
MCDNCKHCEMPHIQHGRRKKLWEIRSDMHCSILGTCLEHAELMKIAHQSGQISDPNVTEYQVHSHFVHLAEEPNRPARLMHKKLDQKYHTAIRTFASARTESELKKLWFESLEKGDVPGPYWALMSHPCLTHSLLIQAFGEVHMLSHLNGANNHAKAKSLKTVKKALAKTKRQLILQSEKRQSTINQHAKQIKELKQKLMVAEQNSLSNEELSERLRQFESGDQYQTLKHDAEQLTIELDRAVRARDDYANRLDLMNQELSALKKDFATVVKKVKHLELESTLEQRSEIQSRDNLEVSILSEYDSLDLTGKNIAYVGGRPTTIRNFRDLVENLNGTLIHHDGGIQDNMKSLTGVLNRADIVLCPVECVSHGACNKAKSYCKRTAKPFVPLRSTGISSLISGLKQSCQFRLQTGS